jgi:hypothetical protein
MYSRDLTKLTDIEKDQVQKAEVFKNKAKKDDLIISGEDMLKYHSMLPTSHYFNISLFPNNYINSKFNIEDLNYDQLLVEFENLVENNNSNERDILNFISSNKAYFIIESIFEHFNFGHHFGTFLFKEFSLPGNYRTDFTLIGKNSGGYELIFIELEHPNHNITTKQGEFGDGIRKGINQIEDWDTWLDANFSSLKNELNKKLNKSTSLPSEFYELDKSRIHYVVVAGKRIHYLEKTYRLRRKIKKDKNIHLLHYDNLIADTKTIIKRIK